MFAGRPILEVRASKPVEAMRRLDEMPDVEKTSIFGAAVHAVMRSAEVSPEEIAARLTAAGVTASCRVVEPSLEDAFLDIAERSAFVKALAVASKEIRQILRDRRTLSIVLFVPAFFLLLYGYALNFDIRNIPLAVQDNDRSSASRDVISAFVQLRILCARSGCAEQTSTSSAFSIAATQERCWSFQADSVATRRAASRPAVQFIISGDNANTATTVMAYAVGPRERASPRATKCRRASVAPAAPLLTAETAGLVQPGASQHPASSCPG